MILTFTDLNIYDELPDINEDVYVKFNCTINKETFKVLYDKVLKLIETTNYSVYDEYNGVKYILNPEFAYNVELDKTLYMKELKRGLSHLRRKQGNFYKKLAIINGLQLNHKYELLSKKRGLTEEDIEQFFSWKPNVVIIPSLFENDCIGIAGLRLYKEDNAYCIKTINEKGIMIPVFNESGHAFKYQLKSDFVKGNCKLKARTKGGVSIMHSDYYDTQSKIYYLGDEYRIIKSNYTGVDILNITTNEIISTYEGEEIIEYFSNYPEIIASIKPENKAKYKWLAKGSMILSDIFEEKVNKTENLIMTNKQSHNEPNTILITEGILKGIITNKYFKDKNLITLSTPGVAKSMLEEIITKVKTFNNIDEVLIAYDTDACYNRSVVEAISYLYQKLRRYFKVKVLNWDTYKGIDDALLAGVKSFKKGLPRDFYPIEKSDYPYPYHINGKRASTHEWILEYENLKKQKNKKLEKLESEEYEQI